MLCLSWLYFTSAPHTCRGGIICINAYVNSMRMAKHGHREGLFKDQTHTCAAECVALPKGDSVFDNFN